MIRVLACLTLLFWLLAVPAPAQDDKPAQPPEQEQEDLQKRMKGMQAEMTAIRGLAFKSDVKLGLYSKEELVKFLRAEMEKETPREKMVKYQKALIHFGLLPKDFELYEATIKLLSSSIAGFYHPRTKELRLIWPRAKDPSEELFEKQLGVSMDDITLVHEACHAAQDQNFDLTTLPLEEENNDDMVEAIQALIEGDASLVGWDYALKDQFDLLIPVVNSQYKSGEIPGEGQDMPACLRKTLTFPYGHGADFVLTVWRRNKRDWKAVSKMFDDPPSSTEQILHPKKYYSKRDNPIIVTLPDIDKLVGDKWKELVNNVHGEFGMRLIFDEFKAQASAKRLKAAAGWGGDRFFTFENNGRLMTVWYTVWDTEEDAGEFFDAYSQLIAVKYPQSTKTPSDQKNEFDATADAGGLVLIERRGADVLVLDGADKATIEKANDLWKSAVKQELKKVERIQLLWECPNHPQEKSSKPGKCSLCGSELKKREEKKDY